jgi:hypothetical protein
MTQMKSAAAEVDRLFEEPTPENDVSARTNDPAGRRAAWQDLSILAISVSLVEGSNESRHIPV